MEKNLAIYNEMRTDNADTLDVAPVAPADSIQATEGSDNADTYGTAAALRAAHRATLTARPLLRASYEFYPQDGGEVARGGVFVTSFNEQAKKINILQKSYIKIWLYNVFVVPLQCVNKTNV